MNELYVLVLIAFIIISCGVFIGVKSERERAIQAGVAFYEYNEKTGDVTFKYREMNKCKEEKLNEEHKN